VALGANGNVWFTADGVDDAAIGRITPNGVVRLFSAGLDEDADPRGITAGPGGLWFTERDENKIGRITINGAVTQFDGGSHDEPTRIVAGPDGNLWYTARGDGGAIGRITPTGTVTEFPTQGEPEGIAVGADSDRPYKKGWPLDDALDEIRAQSGRHFDPDLVEAFLPIAPGAFAELYDAGHGRGGQETASVTALVNQPEALREPVAS